MTDAQHTSPEPMAESPMDAPITLVEQTILDLCAARGVGKSICPTEAARAIAALKAKAKAASQVPDPEAWHAWLTDVRRMAIHLARQGKLVILRKGKPVDPDDFRGVYRLALPFHE